MHDPTANAYDDVPRERRVFCNRTLNLESIRAIGYDMDYTLVHYNMAEWEERAFHYTRRGLAESGWPVEDLEFDPDRVARGLIVDRELGNIVKANRFGYIKQAKHGTRKLSYGELRETYARTFVDLGAPRWVFINTLFSISAAWMYLQLVDKLDDGELPNPIGYDDLWGEVQKAVDEAHLEGKLKAEITDEPERYVELDPEMPPALLDQREAGNRLMLITNSGWKYTRFMMSYAVDRYLPKGMNWRDLFEISVVAAGKPDFFTTDKPIFELADDSGLVRPVVGGLEESGIYLGGNAQLVEDYLDVSGDRILFVGDHIFSDVNVSKKVLRWRTALVMRELEREVRAVESARERQNDIQAKMNEKADLEREVASIRLRNQRRDADYAEVDEGDAPRSTVSELRDEMKAVDDEIAPMVAEDGKEFNPDWGYLMRAGNDKSHLTRQVERYADIYTSRVSNFLHYTPYVYFRAPRGSLPHDPVEN